ncbi:MAG: hypothetical protein ACFFBV_10840 [Promethearchaeota archaeon]
MKLEKQKERFYFFIIIILFILSVNIFTLNIVFGQNSANIAKNSLNTLEIEKQGKIHTSSEIPHQNIEWLKNSDFNTTEYWVSNITGDSRDIDANINNDQANYYILGDQGTYSNVSGTPTSSYWKNVTNTNFPSLPSFQEIDDYGCHVYHSWQDPEDPFQMVSIHWDRNITLPDFFDITDYNITSASLTAIVNATVTPYGTTPLYRRGVDVEGDTIDGSDPDFQREYDYVRFYVLISDLQKNYTYELAYNQTKNLGQDSGPTISNMIDTEMFTYSEEKIISHLTTVLEKDPDHRSFTLTLGMRIYCADNGMGDNDTWNSLRIKSCNFSFAYEKIINKFSYAVWEQESNEISGNNVQITDAILNFDYKINQTWSMALSPNSEIRILINGKQHTETLRLSNAPLTFQEAKVGGFDVSTLISAYINISISIQVFLGDEFGLDQEVKISIDNVSLKISYFEIFSDVLPEPLIFRILLIVALVASLILGSYLVLYQKILKYPKPVRKVRKYKRTLRRKKAPSTPISSRERSFTASFNKELSTTASLRKGKPTEQKIEPTKKVSTVPKNPSSNNVNNTSEKLESNNNTNLFKHPTKRKDQKRFEKLKKRKHISKSLSFSKHQKFFILIIILLILLLNPFIIRIVNTQNYSEFKNNEFNFKEIQNPESLSLSAVNSVTREWLQNSEFDTSEHWNLLKEETGDKDDIDGNISQGQANYKVLGEIRTYSNISGPPDDTWTRVVNPNFPDLPDTAQIIDGYGCYVSHEWAERADQSPSVHWDKNVTMPVSMSDYIIKSVSLNTVVNATVQATGGGSGGIDVPGDTITVNATHDYVSFYVLLSDLSKEKVYKVAYNQTKNLGQDSNPTITNMLDTALTNVPQKRLIEYLTSVLRTDNLHFTITLGIRIWCEDNFNWDEDDWVDLWIKSCNLSFTYERKIDRFTAISWNQVGDDISGDNIQITEANLRFKYKIDQLWPVSAPYSEIRVLINDNPLTGTELKLSSATLTFQEAKEGGYDVTTLISKDINISLSIQIFILDELFSLDRNITVSIDDVFLEISYDVFYRDILEEPWFFTTLLVIASVITAGVGGYLVAYQKYLKYPRPVRKVRKFKRTLRKTKEPNVIIMPREIAFRRMYSREISGSSIKLAKTKPLESTLPEKLGAEPVEPTMEPEELIEKSIEKKTELDKLVKDSVEEASKK